MIIRSKIQGEVRDVDYSDFIMDLRKSIDEDKIVAGLQKLQYLLHDLVKTNPESPDVQKVVSDILDFLPAEGKPLVPSTVVAAAVECLNFGLIFYPKQKLDENFPSVVSALLDVLQLPVAGAAKSAIAKLFSGYGFDLSGAVSYPGSLARKFAELAVREEIKTQGQSSVVSSFNMACASLVSTAATFHTLELEDAQAIGDYAAEILRTIPPSSHNQPHYEAKEILEPLGKVYPELRGRLDTEFTPEKRESSFRAGWR